MDGFEIGSDYWESSFSARLFSSTFYFLNLIFQK